MTRDSRECAYCGKIGCQHQAFTDEALTTPSTESLRAIGESNKIASWQLVNKDGALIKPGEEVREGDHFLNPRLFANDYAGLEAWVCGALGHPIAVRNGDRRTLSCVCGRWKKQIVSDPDGGATGEVLITALKHEKEQLQKRVAELREAIEPFARLGGEAEHLHYRDESPVYGINSETITYGDLRRAWRVQ